jgi:hypothetical protein
VSRPVITLVIGRSVGTCPNTPAMPVNRSCVISPWAAPRMPIFVPQKLPLSIAITSTSFMPTDTRPRPVNSGCPKPIATSPHTAVVVPNP